MNDRSHGLLQSLPLYAACYALWFVFSAVTIWTMLQMRDALMLLLPVIGPWVMGAVDKIGLVTMGLAALVWILYLEHYLSEGVGAGVFWRRAGRIAVIHLVALAAVYGVKLAIWWWV